MRIGNVEVYGIIYKITNMVNNKIYIGQTAKGFNARYQFKGVGIERVYNKLKCLKDNCHPYNKHLLSSIEIYGLDKFDVCEVFDVAFSKDELNIKEQVYISILDSYKNGYNRNIGGEGNSGSEGLYGGLNPNSKPVVQIDKHSGEVVQVFDSIKEASLKTNINKKSISAVCNGRDKSAKGYIWVLVSEYDEDKNYKISKNHKY